MPLVYFIKGRIKGRKGRRQQKTPKPEAVAVSSSANHEPLPTILKVKKAGGRSGRDKKLKGLVEAMGE